MAILLEHVESSSTNRTYSRNVCHAADLIPVQPTLYCDTSPRLITCVYLLTTDKVYSYHLLTTRMLMAAYRELACPTTFSWSVLQTRLSNNDRSGDIINVLCCSRGSIHCVVWLNITVFYINCKHEINITSHKNGILENFFLWRKY